MEMYVEYYKDVTPIETPQHKYSTEQVMPQLTPRTSRITTKEMVERATTDRREQPLRESISGETRLKQGMDEDTPTSTSSGDQPKMTMSPITPTITQLLTSKFFLGLQLRLLGL